MNTRLYSEEELREMGFEEMSIEEFDSLESDHEFSDAYNRKKNVMLNALSKEKPGMAGRMYYRVAVAAVAALFVVPVTAFAATKLYSMQVNRNKTKTSIEITQNETNTEQKKDTSSAAFSNYEVVPTYLPNGCKALGEAYGSNKYGGGETESQLGLSIWTAPWEEGKKFVADIMDSTDAKQFSGDGYDGVIVSKSETYAYDKEVFLMYEKEALLIHIYAGYGIDSDEIKKVADGLTLTKTTDVAKMVPTEASLFQTAEETAEEDAETKEALENYEVVELGEEILFGYMGEGCCAATVENVELRDNIAGLDESGLQTEEVKPFVDEKGNFIAYNRTEVLEGNADTVSSYGETVPIKKKLVYITLKIDNQTGRTVDYCAGNQIWYRKQKENGEVDWKLPNYVRDGNPDLNAEHNEPVYLDTSREGTESKDYYFMNLEPGENIIHVGYLVDEDWTDCMYLQMIENGLSTDNKFIKLFK